MGEALVVVLQQRHMIFFSLFLESVYQVLLEK
jgi:hypothetical protein